MVLFLVQRWLYFWFKNGYIFSYIFDWLYFWSKHGYFFGGYIFGRYNFGRYIIRVIFFPPIDQYARKPNRH